MNVAPLYESELSKSDPIYRLGVQRGYQGSVMVPDAEHNRLMTCEDRDVVVSYRSGLLCGQNLRIWALMKASPSAAR